MGHPVLATRLAGYSAAGCLVSHYISPLKHQLPCDVTFRQHSWCLTDILLWI